MAKKRLTFNVDIDELMMEFIPKIARQYIRNHTSPQPSEDMPDDIPDDVLQNTLIENMDDVLENVQGASPDDPMVGTTLSLSVNFFGDLYSYSVTDGVVLDAFRGKLDAPMIFLDLPLEALVVIGKMRYLDILLGMQSRFTKESFDLITQLKGTVVFKLKDPDGFVARIGVTFNNGRKPETVVSLLLEDARRFTAGKVSSTDLLEEGKLALDGDLDFAVSLKDLFS